MATATTGAISLRIATQHPTDVVRVAAIVAHVRATGAWDMPPVLVIEDEGNGYELLDGHHRSAAARILSRDPDWCALVATIPAYVLSIADYCAIVEEHFDGSAPSRLVDLDDYIMVEGAPYRRDD